MQLWFCVTIGLNFPPVEHAVFAFVLLLHPLKTHSSGIILVLTQSMQWEVILQKVEWGKALQEQMYSGFSWMQAIYPIYSLCVASHNYFPHCFVVYSVPCHTQVNFKSVIILKALILCMWFANKMQNWAPIHKPLCFRDTHRKRDV